LSDAGLTNMRRLPPLLPLLLLLVRPYFRL
jgi:hypothetical protein